MSKSSNFCHRRGKAGQRIANDLIASGGSRQPHRDLVPVEKLDNKLLHHPVGNPSRIKGRQLAMARGERGRSTSERRRYRGRRGRRALRPGHQVRYRDNLVLTVIQPAQDGLAPAASRSG
jgi:hypothetical protein